MPKYLRVASIATLSLFALAISIGTAEPRGGGFGGHGGGGGFRAGGGGGFRAVGGGGAFRCGERRIFPYRTCWLFPLCICKRLADDWSASSPCICQSEFYSIGWTPKLCPISWRRKSHSICWNLGSSKPATDFERHVGQEQCQWPVRQSQRQPCDRLVAGRWAERRFCATMLSPRQPAQGH